MRIKNPFSSGKQLPVFCIILAIILLVLIVGTGYAAAGFRTEAQGSASAEIAVYSLSVEDLTKQDLEIDCNTDNTSASYRFTVSNEENQVVSQINVEYSIQISLSEAIPKGVAVSLDGESASPRLDGLKYLFHDADPWQFTANSPSTNIHTLTFATDKDILADDVLIDNVIITVFAQQKD